MSAIFEWVPEPGTLGLFEWLVDEPELDAGTHASIRAGIVAGFKQVFGREPTQREALFAQGVELCETGYGNWASACKKWGPELCCGGVGSYNYGAQQSGRPPCDPSMSFECVDRHRNGERYNVCFRKFATAADGQAGFLRVLYISNKRDRVLAAASGGVKDFAFAMSRSGYYELAPEQYAENLNACIGRIAKALNEPAPPFETASESMSGTKLVLWAAVAGAAGYAAWRFLPGVRALVLA